MIQDYIDMIDMDTQEKVRYISESSNASTSGYSTMSPGPGSCSSSTMVGGTSPSSSSVFSMSPSPVRSPATALQTEFSNLCLPANPNQHQQMHATNYTYMQRSSAASNYMQHNGIINGNNLTVLPQQQQEFHAKSNNYTAELRILEHPVEKFRFRYKSEMHGTHGSLNGANSKRTPKTFPEVELCNFQGHAVIRCSVFQTNIESPHSHQLVVRKDDTDICDPHDVFVSPERGYVAQFQNMGIIHTAKKFICEELLNKKVNRLRFELGVEELSTKQMQTLRKETELEAKDMNLNQVRLCFEAFQVSNGNWTRITAPVFTSPINNRKSAQTGELRICRLSIATGSVAGGDDIILLVEKVSKKNIQVRFYEVDENEEVVWQALAKFRESDVHHQYAIVCQTPPYRDTEIERPVDVLIDLIRISDDEHSYPSVSFCYKPRDAIASRKRRRTNSSNNSGLDSSVSSYELPKVLQDHIGFIPGTASVIPNALPPAPMHAPTISEEFDKDSELQKLTQNDLIQQCVNTDSEDLAKLCPQNISDFLDEIWPGRLETDGVSSTPKATNFKKSILLRAAPLVNNNEHLKQILKIFDQLLEGNIGGGHGIAAAANQIKDIFYDFSERNIAGDSILHEIIASDNHIMGIKVCQMFKNLDLVHVLTSAYNVKGESGLHVACLYDRTDFIRPLLSLGCDPNAQDEFGNTPLHIAVREQHRGCVEALLRNHKDHINTKTKNDEGLTPLHLAIRLNSYAIVQALLQYDGTALTVTTTKDGNNVLQIAILQQNIEVVKLILAQKKSNDLLMARNAAGLTALNLAQELRNELGNEILKLMSTQAKQRIKEEPKENELTSRSATVVTEQVVIKEEVSSSSTDDDDDDDEQETHEHTTSTLELIGVKEEEQSIEPVLIASTSLINALNDAQRFEQLAASLNKDAKWKCLAEKMQMVHLSCVWTNSKDMLNYIKSNIGIIDAKLFAKALNELDADTHKLL